MKNIFLLVSIACLTLAGCGDSKPTLQEGVISLVGQAGNIIEFEVEGGESSDRQVAFTATSSWTASIAPATGTRSSGSTRAPSFPVDWVRMMINDGEKYNGPAGTYTATIEIDANPTDAPRSATITISCGNSKVSIVIEQVAG